MSYSNNYSTPYSIKYHSHYQDFKTAISQPVITQSSGYSNFYSTPEAIKYHCNWDKIRRFPSLSRHHIISLL